MKRIVLVLALVAGLFFLPTPARATCSSLNLTAIANGLTNDATPVVTAFNGLFSCATTVDNTQIGALGIFATQMIPTTVGQAVFGGTQMYKFPASLTVATNNDANVVLTLTGNSPTQTGNYINVTKVGSGAGGIFSVDQFGNMTGSGSLVLTVPGTGCTTQVCIANDNGGGPGMTFNVPSGSLNQYQFGINGGSFFKLQILGSFTNFIPGSATKPFNFSNATNTKNNFQITDTGNASACPLINALQTCAQLTPVYNAAGTAIGAGAHEVNDTLTTNLFGNCLAGALCVLNNGTVNFTNAGVFTGAGSYRCQVSQADPTGSAFIAPNYTRSSGVTMIITAANPTNATITTGTQIIVTYSCKGT